MSQLPQDPTEREVVTAVNALTLAVQDLHGLIKGMSAIYVRQDLYEKDQAQVQKDLSNLKGWNEWAVRLVMGAIILGLLGLVLHGVNP